MEQRAPQPLVGIWLLVICALVFAMIMVGGATRLTDSGLSITEWRLDKGLTPPLTDARWAEEFALYQRTTEYQVQNRGMSLGEFQTIYWWEWGHRFLGKLIGVVFALPFLFFLLTGRLRGRLVPVLALFALGGLQGAIGWWMVTSGLVGRLDVSPIRLAVHLGMAFLIIGGGFWLALDAFGWPKRAARINAPRSLLIALPVLIFAQVIFGALLAGADGGMAYADWPTIGGELFPATYAQLDPILRNLTENHAAQHFNHRTLGYVVAIVALAVAWFGWRRGEGSARALAAALAAVVVFQVILGIVTVLHAAPVSLSLIHQAGAAVLFLVSAAVLRAGGNKLPLS